MAACKCKVNISDLWRGGAGYVHTHFDGSDADLDILSTFPLQDMFQQIAGTAWTEANIMWEVLGYFTDLLMQQPPPIADVLDVDIDTDDVLDEPTTRELSEAEDMSNCALLKQALQATSFISVALSDHPDLPVDAENTLNKCGLAAAALNMHNLAFIESLPDKDPQSLSELQEAFKSILAAISALGPVGQVTVNKLLNQATIDSSTSTAVKDEHDLAPVLSHISDHNLIILATEASPDPS
ncbi:hypothetical protein BDN71DRAFT_1504854 [Pleurotus eryngii]|uniref:Uncharacterized protein n=1 Tax=Pleurotus eryngii TaxID=5323 RepID=A0A9P5ZZU6_PLEER|nr:hypothetical protein BDN71DRAFT_1504854 [Pleurotus eryngii]